MLIEIQDELAETSIPSPPPIDTIEDDYVSYDPYDYWLDIEYGTDEYYDVGLRKASAPSGTKRKSTGKVDAANKRRKLDNQTHMGVETERIWTGPNVVFKSSSELNELNEPCQSCGKLKPYALLPDWKRIAENAPEMASHKLEDIDAASSHSGSSSRHDSGQQLDMSDLMSVLQQQEGGVDGIRDMLLGMLSNGEGMDMEQLLEKLTKDVLAQVDKGGAGSGMGQWLAQQGVQLPDEPNDMDTEGELADTPVDAAEPAAPGAKASEAPPAEPKGKKRKVAADDSERVSKQPRTKAEPAQKRVTRSSKRK